MGSPCPVLRYLQYLTVGLFPLLSCPTFYYVGLSTQSDGYVQSYHYLLPMDSVDYLCGWMCQYTSGGQSRAVQCYCTVLVPSPCMWHSSSSQFDGKGFIIDGVAYLCKNSKAARLTIFGSVVSRMMWRLPYLLTTSQECQVSGLPQKRLLVEEIKARLRRDGYWTNMLDARSMGQLEWKDNVKPMWINCHRLANMPCCFSFEQREVSSLGEAWPLVGNLSTSVFEKVVSEFNKNNITWYSDISADFLVTGAKYLTSIGKMSKSKKLQRNASITWRKPENFWYSRISWFQIKDAAESNAMATSCFTNYHYHYIVYWILLAKLHEGLFSTLTGQLDATVLQESVSHSARVLSASVHSEKQKC